MVIGSVFLLLTIAVTASNQTKSTRVGSLTVVSRLVAYDFETTVDQPTATTAALNQVHQMRPDVTGIRVKAANIAAGLLQVKNSQGQVIYSNSDPVNDWVLDLTGPSQLGYSIVTGAAIIDASNGKVHAVSILLTNP